MSEPQSLARAAACIMSIDPSADATDHKVNFRDFVPLASGISSGIIWAGSNAAVLWYYPATPRSTFTASEATYRAANPNPVARGAEHLAFPGTGAEFNIQATGIDDASTAGVWKVAFT